jgi:hypothetical protein
MANQYPAIDPNTTRSAILANSGTGNTGLETRRVVATDGNLHVLNLGGVSPIKAFDNIVTTYPDGTTEVYTYKLGTLPVGTTTAVYLDTTKGSISTVTRS